MKPASKNASIAISNFLSSFVSLGVFVYFAFHLVHGDMGYFAMRGAENKAVALQQKHETLLQDRIALENRVKLLRPDSLDLDMLDERARTVLGFVREDERVILQIR